MAQVLVVDDEVLVRETVRIALQRAGHQVTEAADGQKALELLASGKIDLVISDIIMPEVDGIGLILAMRKRHPNLRVIAMSGGGRTRNMDFLRMAKSLGAHSALPKPFTPEQLQNEVRNVLRMPVLVDIPKKQ